MTTIRFEDDGTGAFTVVGGTLPRIPKGWLEVSPVRFEPQWPACRYRRLSTLFVKQTPVVIPHCLLFNKNVTCETCFSCTEHKPEIKYVPITDEILNLLDANEPVDGTIIKEECPECEDQDDVIDDPVFGLPQRQQERLAAAQQEHKKRTRWKPCVHRELREGDKECCPERYCTNNECPLVGKKLVKRDCLKCDYREPIKPEKCQCGS